MRQFFKEKVYRTVIPRNVRLGEAPSHGMPVILYDVNSRGAEAYLALARTGTTFQTRWVHTFRVASGKVTQFREFQDSYAVAAAFTSVPSPDGVVH